MSAVMYPSSFIKRPDLNPMEQAGEEGEEIVYKVLKERLPSDWVVFHGIWRYFMKDAEKSYSNKGLYVNHEADFVVLVPDKGMVVIEVKNVNNVRVDEKGLFYYGNAKEGKISPAKQAHITAGDFAYELGLLLNKKVEYRTLAVMLKQSREDLPEDLHFRDFYLFNREIETCNLQEKIKGLFERDNIFCYDDIDRIVGYWWTAHKFKTDPRMCAAVIEQAAAPLRLLLPALELNEEGIRVNGCAGSGKTWLACKEMERLLAKDGRNKILFLCYNRLLAESLAERREFKSRKDGRVVIKTFFSFLLDVLKHHNIRHEPNDYSFSANEWDVIKNALAEEEAFRYDYVFIDEAQDLDNKCWDAMYAIMDHTDAKVYVFCDSNQLLYGDDYVPALGVRVDLTKNLRNSLDIASFSNEFIDVEPEPLPLKCNEVVVMDAIEDVNARAQCVTELIQKLKNEYHLNDADIVVLTPWKEDSADNSAVLISGLTPYSAKKSRKLCRSSIKKYKGLERDFVILSDIPAPGYNHFTKSDLYVACTRAKYGLYIIPMNQESAEGLKESLYKSKNEIES